MSSSPLKKDPAGGSLTSRLYPIDDLDQWNKANSRSLLQIRTEESLRDKTFSKSALSLDSSCSSSSSSNTNGIMAKKIPLTQNPSSDSEESILGHVQDPDSSGSCPSLTVTATSTTRWYVCIAIVVYGMIFNGSVYGFTSPALLTLQDQSAGNRDRSNTNNNNLSLPEDSPMRELFKFPDSHNLVRTFL